MSQLQDLYTELMARLPHLTWLDGLDLLLVTIIFSLLLGWVRRSRATFLFRERCCWLFYSSSLPSYYLCQRLIGYCKWPSWRCW